MTKYGYVVHGPEPECREDVLEAEDASIENAEKRRTEAAFHEDDTIVHVLVEPAEDEIAKKKENTALTDVAKHHAE